MDYIKVQCELLKEYGKNKEPKSFITSIDNFTYASVNGRWCAVIPTEKWLLNLPEMVLCQDLVQVKMRFFSS